MPRLFNPAKWGSEKALSRAEKKRAAKYKVDAEAASRAIDKAGITNLSDLWRVPPPEEPVPDVSPHVEKLDLLLGEE